SEGGHIGYCVLPDSRGHGHATAILQQSIVIARAAGVERVLVTCDETNVASSTVIERCGGEFESAVLSADGGPPKLRYWIA
ncbi:MAG: GNAT family N-acetyltransferase, partial [Ilumatobacteraceae bacterium]